VVISFIAQPRTRAFCHPVPGARITLPYQQRLYLQPSLVGIASWANPAEARTGIKPPLTVSASGTKRHRPAWPMLTLIH